MAHDLFLGRTKQNFARDLGPALPMSDEVTLAFTESEKAELANVASLRLLADGGDKAAKRKLATFTKKVAALKAHARKGDPKAKRALVVLRESGIFNETQTFALGWNLFKKENPEDRLVRVERFAVAIKSASKPEDIAKLSEIATYDQALKDKLGVLAREGNANALKVAAFTSKNKSAVVGADSRAEDLKQKIEKLLQKNPKTAEDNRVLESLTERLTRLEAMSGIGAWNPLRKAARRARRARKLANLKSRAAAGDQRAIARLQQMQADLNLATATPGTVPPAPPLPPAAPVAPSAYPSYPYQTPYQAPYQAPSVPPYYQDADGNYYQTQPQPGQAQPTIDVFVGQRSRRRAEEAMAEQEDRGNVGWYGNSFVGGSGIGNAIPHENYRVAVMKAAVKSASGAQPSTKDYFKAKAAVDKVIGKSGITIYMPGAKPGRRTI